MKTIVIADLHLGAPGSEPDDRALVSFLDWLHERARDDSEPCRLVVLGDLLDLLHPPDSSTGPLAALESVAARHRPALAALGAAVADTCLRVELVPGNHDSELLEPDVQERLLRIVADASGTSPERLRSGLHIQPWFLLVPGVLYAEHGSQYHPLNAVSDPLRPCGRWSRRLPPGAVLDLYLSGTQGRTRLHAGAAVRLLPAALSSLARNRPSHASGGTALAALARETGLSPTTIAALRELALSSPVPLIRSAAGARGRTNRVETYQQRAALAVHRLLAGESKAVPTYVFAHTHRAAERTLDAHGTELRWFNTGAWSPLAYSFVEVSTTPAGVAAGLRRWDPLVGAARTPGGPPALRAAPAQMPVDRIATAADGSAVPVGRP